MQAVLLPAGYAKIRKSARRIDVKAIYAAHFADVPRPRAADRITLLEEDKVVAAAAEAVAVDVLVELTGRPVH